MSGPWSYSAVSQYLRCPLQYWFRRVLGMPERFTPGPLALGSALHEALAAYHRGLQSGRPIQPDQVKATFHRAWGERRDRELVTFPRGTEAGHVDQGVALIEAYLRHPPPSNIVAVEQELTVPLLTSSGETLEAPLVAVLDLVTRDDRDALVVSDLKTSSRAYSDMDAALSIQATAYVHAAQAAYGEAAAFRFLVLVKTKTAKLQAVPTARTDADIRRLGDLVRVVAHAIDQGAFYPVETPHNCSGCSYRKPCRDWQADQTLPHPSDRIPLPTLEGRDAA